MRQIFAFIPLLAACDPGTTPAPSVTIPPNPPQDVEIACAIPPVERDAFQALITHRLALVTCRNAALLNATERKAVAEALANYKNKNGCCTISGATPDFEKKFKIGG